MQKYSIWPYKKQTKILNKVATPYILLYALIIYDNILLYALENIVLFNLVPRTIYLFFIGTAGKVLTFVSGIEAAVIARTNLFTWNMLSVVSIQGF